MTKSLVLAALMSLPGSVFAGSLTTTTSNNGAGGIFMELTAAGTGVQIVSFEAYFTTVGPASVQVFTRLGTYSGFTDSSAGWTLFDTVGLGSTNGAAALTGVILSSSIQIAAGQTLAIYLAEATGNGIRYNGTNAAPPQTTWSNADLSMFSDRSRTGGIPFGGTLFSPRTFAGNVNYDLDSVPEPGSFVLLGLGLAGFCCLRRKIA